MKKSNSDRMQKLGGGIVTLFILVALTANFLANETPIFYNDGQQAQWPLLDRSTQENIDWKNSDARIVFPPIPFSATRINLSSRFQPPLSKEIIAGRSYRHWLGTDRLGRDVAAGMVHGCRKSLWVGFFAMLLAGLIGVIVGAVAGWFGNRQLKLPWWALVLSLLCVAYLSYLTYYGLLSWQFGLTLILFVSILMFFARSSRMYHPYIPVDATMMRAVEILSALPALLLLMVLSTLLSAPSLTLLAVIIALLRWPRFALFVRSEVQKIKARNDILAAKISGLSNQTILFRMVLPEVMRSVAVIFAFGVASAIILESTLSFLGIGVPLDEVTWGSILGQARENISAWWLAIYPGIAIFILIMSLNILGERLRIRLHPHF